MFTKLKISSEILILNHLKTLTAMWQYTCRINILFDSYQLQISVGSFIIVMQPTHPVTQTCSKGAAGNGKQELSDKKRTL